MDVLYLRIEALFKLYEQYREWTDKHNMSPGFITWLTLYADPRAGKKVEDVIVRIFEVTPQRKRDAGDGEE